LVGKNENISDYHFALLTGDPPDTTLNNKNLHFQRMKVFVINPEDVVECSNNGSTKPYYSIMVKPELFRRITEEMDFTGELRFLNPINPYSFDLLHTVKMFDMETARADGSRLMMECLEIQIATLLLRELKTNIKKISLQVPDNNAYIRLAKEYLQTFLSSDISIDDICSEIHVSPFHFIRIFKEKTGMSPHQYLLNARIEKAQELLSKGRYSVSETAVLCGFVGISHFSSTFKQITGSSPSDFKKRLF
jgi:AraC-like DNA-binding protein